MKRYDVLPGLSGRRGGHSFAWPCVANGDSIDLDTGGRPDCGKAIDEYGPESRNQYDGDRGGLGGRVRKEVIYRSSGRCRERLSGMPTYHMSRPAFGTKQMAVLQCFAQLCQQTCPTLQALDWIRV